MPFRPPKNGQRGIKMEHMGVLTCERGVTAIAPLPSGGLKISGDLSLSLFLSHLWKGTDIREREKNTGNPPSPGWKYVWRLIPSNFLCCASLSGNGKELPKWRSNLKKELGERVSRKWVGEGARDQRVLPLSPRMRWVSWKGEISCSTGSVPSYFRKIKIHREAVQTGPMDSQEGTGGKSFQGYAGKCQGALHGGRLARGTGATRIPIRMDGITARDQRKEGGWEHVEPAVTWILTQGSGAATINPHYPCGL